MLKIHNKNHKPEINIRYITDMFDTPEHQCLYKQIEDNSNLADSGKLCTHILDRYEDIEADAITGMDDFKDYLKETFGIY